MALLLFELIYYYSWWSYVEDVFGVFDVCVEDFFGVTFIAGGFAFPEEVDVVAVDDGGGWLVPTSQRGLSGVLVVFFLPFLSKRNKFILYMKQLLTIRTHNMLSSTKV